MSSSIIRKKLVHLHIILDTTILVIKKSGRFFKKPGVTGGVH